MYKIGNTEEFSNAEGLALCNEWQIRSTPELDVLAPFCI